MEMFDKELWEDFEEIGVHDGEKSIADTKNTMMTLLAVAVLVASLI